MPLKQKWRSERKDFPSEERLLTVERYDISGSAAEFRSVCSPLFDVSPLDCDARAEPRHFSGVLYFLGDFVFCRIVSGGAVLRRERRHILRSGPLLAFLQLKHGRLIGESDGRAFSARSGQLALHDYGRPFSALLSPAVLEAVFVPRPDYRSRVATSGAVSGFYVLDGLEEPFFAICAEVMERLQFSPENVSQKDLELLNLGAQQLVFDGSADLSPFRAERAELLRDIQQFIEQNLSALELSAAMLLARFGVSRATLFRLFEPFGGVRTYILERRLFRALLDISEQPNLRGQIQRAVERWGFSSATHFHRAVKRSFGVTPGAMFSTGLSDPALSDERNWAALLDTILKRP